MDKTKETSKREQALAWWKTIPTWYLKTQMMTKYGYDSLLVTEDIDLHPTDIVEIWKKETKRLKDLNDIVETFPKLKPNKKQFVEFNEDLFKTYIAKFSEEDQKEMFSVFCDILKMGEISEKDLNDLEMMKFNYPG